MKITAEVARKLLAEIVPDERIPVDGIRADRVKALYVSGRVTWIKETTISQSSSCWDAQFWIGNKRYEVIGHIESADYEVNELRKIDYNC